MKAPQSSLEIFSGPIQIDNSVKDRSTPTRFLSVSTSLLSIFSKSIKCSGSSQNNKTQKKYLDIRYVRT
jgi:hypothetical protein